MGKKNRKQQQKTKRLIALEINKMKLAHPPTPPISKKYLLNSSSLAIYKAKKEITAASTTDISEYPIPRKYCNCKKNTIRKLISIIQQTLQKSWLNFGTDQIICDNNKQF